VFQVFMDHHFILFYWGKYL